MNILHLTTWYPGDTGHCGGAEHACKRMVSAGAQHNAQTVLHYPGNTGSFLNGLMRIFFPVNPFVNPLKYRTPDILFLHNFKYWGLSVIKQAKRRGIPIVMAIYDYWLICPKDNLYNAGTRESCAGASPWKCMKCYQPKGRRWPTLMKWPLLFRHLIVKHYLKDVAAFVVLSDDSMVVLETKLHIPPEKVHVIRQYADLPVLPRRPKHHSILYAGWISPNKGLHVLLYALKNLIIHIPDVTLTIAGSAANKEYKAEIDDIIDMYNLDLGYITWAGEHSDVNMPELLAHHEVVCVPEQWRNMGPLIIREAQAAGCLVIASDIGGIRELVTHNRTGVLVTQYNDHLLWEDLLICILQHPDTIKRISDEARGDDLTCWRQQSLMTVQLEELYNELDEAKH